MARAKVAGKRIDIYIPAALWEKLERVNGDKKGNDRPVNISAVCQRGLIRAVNKVLRAQGEIEDDLDD